MTRTCKNCRPEEHTVTDFMGRLQGLVDEPEDDEAQATINSIAGHFGIEPTPKPEMEGDTTSVTADSDGSNETSDSDDHGNAD